MISLKDFQKLDIRIGTVVDAKVPSWSHWVMKLTVDFSDGGRPAKDHSLRHVRIDPKSQKVRSGGGEDLGKRTSFAGIMKYYKPKDLIGKQFPFIINLEPKKVGPEKEISECMMLAAVPKDDEPARSASSKADAGGETAPVLFSLIKKVPNGTKVY